MNQCKHNIDYQVYCECHKPIFLVSSLEDTLSKYIMKYWLVVLSQSHSFGKFAYQSLSQFADLLFYKVESRSIVLILMTS